MDLQIFAPPGLAHEARRFAGTFQVNSIVSSTSVLQAGGEPDVSQFSTCLLYFSGDEQPAQIERPLRALARRRGRLRRVVLYARHPDVRRVVDWGRIAERVLSKPTAFCFSPNDVARVLRVRLREGQVPGARAADARIDVEGIRTTLGLTQAQMATAIGVSERTVQNWEAGRLSPQTAKRLRDLVELKDVLDGYFARDVLQRWLISPNDVCGGVAPQDWITEGRARDLLWEFRRMQTGEPA